METRLEILISKLKNFENVFLPHENRNEEEIEDNEHPKKIKIEIPNNKDYKNVLI